MAKPFKFCPYCATGLVLRIVDEIEMPLCEACGYIQYDNPIPVVAARIKIDRKFVLVQRGVAPFVGKWCMPCGFVNRRESPQFAAKREGLEETHLIITAPELPFRICNLEAVNQHLMFFDGTVIGGSLEKGSDAMAVGLFGLDELPELAFSTHAEELRAAA